MSLGSCPDFDLSDDWIEREGEQPPTLKISIHGSLSGSVNVLSDATQKWANVHDIVSKDLLTKQTKPLTSLFEPQRAPVAVQADEHLHNEGLSVVEEEYSDSENIGHGQEYREAWNQLRTEGKDEAAELSEGEGSPRATIRYGTARSADGLIPNFSFPRTTTDGTALPVCTADEVEARNPREIVSRAASDPLSHPQVSGSDQLRRISSAKSESELNSTPKRHTHRSSNQSVSPTKSPLKLFHTDQDTFTRDHTARMIGMLSGAPAPVMRSMTSTQQGDTQKSHISAISAVSVVSEMTDSGPERKKPRTHEPKGSVTLQNFNDNADRLAAKLKAKAGGLGKGLPRLLDDNKVILGRRISSSSTEQQRRKDRNVRYTSEAQSSGLEDIKIPVDQLPRGPKFGTASTKSHFSDWESEGQPESRQVSGCTQSHICENNRLGSETGEDQTPLESPQEVTPGQSTKATHDAASASTTASQQVRPHSESEQPARKNSPRIKNFPPAAIETLRHGDMIFNTSRQCWQHVDDSEDDPFGHISEVKSPHKAPRWSSGRSSAAGDHYPDELELSSSSEARSVVTLDEHGIEEQSSFSENENDESQATIRVDHFDSTGSSNVTPFSAHDRSPEETTTTISLEEEIARQALTSPIDQEFVERTANITMSQSTSHLVTAINRRYGDGPWEGVRDVDLSGLELDSVVGLCKFFPNLTSLDISNNRLTSLADLPTSLQVLKANGNQLCSHRLSFAHIGNLHSLFLCENQLEDLDSLKPLTHLRHLAVNRNQLSCINALSSLANLISFEGRSNLLSEIDFLSLQAHRSLDSLERIDLAGNKITKISGISSLRRLLDLNLGSNSLRQFEVSEAMPYLKILRISSNNLSAIDLSQFPNIRILDLDDNKISGLTSASTLRRIDTLSLRRQGAENLEIDLAAFCEVRKLFLGGNRLTSFSPPTPFHSLKYLELAGTHLETLHSDLAQLIPNIRVLNLCNNELTEISALAGLDRLERLMLQNNRLASSEEIAAVVVELPRLKALDLRSNTCTRRFYASVATNHDIDYFANLDGYRSSADMAHRWQVEDNKYLASISGTLSKRREAYQNLMWTACRALRWHDGRMIDDQQLLMADEYVESFTEDSLVGAH